MQQPIETPLIAHWSYSSMLMLMRNQLAWSKRYVLKIYDDLYKPSAVVGQACHKAVEMFLKKMPIEAAIAEGLKIIEGKSDATIEYGKTGSREKMLKDYTTGVQFYFDERPDWESRKLIGIEDSITEVIYDAEGNELPLPAKAIIDVVWESKQKERFISAENGGHEYPKGSLFIEDHKFVSSYTDPEDDDPARLIQCMFNYHTVRAKYGRNPSAMLYRETKLSKNRDGSPQSQYYVLHFGDYPHYFDVFYKIFNDCTRYISQPNQIFLPNFQDMFDGKNSFMTYTQNLIGVDAPVAVAKKTQEVTFVDKQFTESALDTADNKNLSSEEKIRIKLLEFGIPVKMLETYSNGSISMYTFKPSRGVRMKSIEAHSKDLALALEAASIRIQAPIMGTDMVGIEVPNKTRSAVNYEPNPSALETMLIPIGIDVYGNTVEKDLRDMPHALIGGTTGSGKSVMLNVILRSLTDQMTPDQMKLVLIDPKRVELSRFKDVPHLMSPVIYEHGRAMRALKWLVEEMEERYTILESAGARNIAEYAAPMPYIVTVIDEFADLMMTSTKGFTDWSFCKKHGKGGAKQQEALHRLMHTKSKRRKAEQLWYEEVCGCAEYNENRDPNYCIRDDYAPAEELVVRLAQKARAVGIHLILATQKPTVNVVTGLIKSNMPTRIAFSVQSKTDSVVMLDRSGAEELVGKGDMLYIDPATKEMRRLQGYYA